MEHSHTEQVLNITPDTGSFLSLMIQAFGSQSILEIGTSDGYSTIWIADAARETGGHVTTVEISEKKADMARQNFRRTGLASYIDVHREDIQSFLKTSEAEIYDLIFLDAERPEYAHYWKEVDRVLKTGCLLIVDNALSPKPEELLDFFRLLNESKRYLTQTLELGNGELLALKQRNS